MIESEWMASTDPAAMLDQLGEPLSPNMWRLGAVQESRISDRKLRLFACACCKVVDGRTLSDLYEKDGVGTTDASWAAVWTRGTMACSVETSRVAAALLRDIVGNPFRPAKAIYDDEDRDLHKLVLVRDDGKQAVYRPSGWLTWNDGAVRRMAEAIYDERAFDRMPILADMLEEAGCRDAEILNHCRVPGQHVRGCWVIDLILGRE